MNKKLLLILIIGMFLLAPSVYSLTTEQLRDATNFSWRFDESSGTTAKEEVQNTASSDGEVSSAQWVSGAGANCGNAFNSNDNNDYISFDTFANLGINTLQRSVAMWVKVLDNTEANNHFLELSGNWDEFVGYFGGSVVLQWYPGYGGYITVSSNWKPTNNEWFHAVFVMDYTNDIQKIFINGNLSVTGTEATNPDFASSKCMVTGGYYESPNECYPNTLTKMSRKTHLDEISIWNGVLLTQTEVDILYNGGNCLQYPFVDESFPTINETSINNSLPKRFDDIMVSALLTDDMSLDWWRIAHNTSGAMVNQTINDISGTSVNATFSFTGSITKGTVVGYQFWFNDTSNNINTSDIYSFTVQNSPPETPTIIFPTSSLRTNTQPLDLNVTFPADDDGDSITISYYINGTINTTSSSNATFNASDGNYLLEVSITDGTDSSSNASVTFDLDTTNPIQTITLPEDLSTHNANITINISCTDLNPFLLNYTIFNSTFGIMKSVQNGSPVGNNLMILDSFDITGIPDAIYTLNSSCSDTHTAKKIPNYITDVDSGNRKITYTTPDENVITIKLKSVPARFSLDSITNTKKTDRYKFGFTPVNQSRNDYVIEVTSRYKINYLSDSSYSAHFVTGRNWIDFENNDKSATYHIVKVSDFIYDVQIRTNDLIFDSIGGLNIVTEQITFTIDTFIPEVVAEEVLPLENVNNIAGMVALLLIILGALGFGRKSKR